MTVVEYRPQWPVEFESLAERLRDVLGAVAVAVDHVGSTSIPGLPAKDCIDVQVRTASIDEELIVRRLASLGFRCSETGRGGQHPALGVGRYDVAEQVVVRRSVNDHDDQEVGREGQRIHPRPRQ